MDKYNVSVSLFKTSKDEHPTHADAIVYANSKDEAIQKAQEQFQYRDVWVKVTHVHKEQEVFLCRRVVRDS